MYSLLKEKLHKQNRKHYAYHVVVKYELVHIAFDTHKWYAIISNLKCYKANYNSIYLVLHMKEKMLNSNPLCIRFPYLFDMYRGN